MNLRYSFVLAFAALAAAAMAANDAPPDSIKASYDVYKDGLHIAVMQESYARNGTKYRIVSESNPAGLLALFIRTKINAESSGSITPAGLQPDRLAYGRLDDPGKNVGAAFDWNAQLLHMTFDGRNETVPLVPGTQDRVSVMYQFMFLSPDQLKLLSFPLTNGKKIEHYRYELVAHEPLDTPLGKLNTLHLAKQRERNENGIEVWLAADRYLFPVKVLFLENDGSKIEQVITQLEFK
jgi:hypothetical protein